MLKKFFFIIACVVSLYAYAHTDWDGKTYNENSEIQNSWAMPLIKDLNLQGNEHLLDIGSGDGKISAFIKSKLPEGKVIGVEPSLSMLQFAKQKYPNITFIEGNIEQLKLDEQFDIVTSFSCLHWVKNKKAALDSIYKVLKPEGKMLLYFGPDYGKNRLDHAIDKVVANPKWGIDLNNVESLYLIKPNDFILMLINTGFEVEKFDIVFTHNVFDTKEEFAEWLSSWLPHLAQLSAEQQKLMIDEIIDTYLSYRKSEDGKIHYYDYMLEVIARKGVNNVQPNEAIKQ
jgi:trans-aconitate methyltransferase